MVGSKNATDSVRATASVGTPSGPTFALTRLRALHRDMRSKRLDRSTFSYRNNRVSVEIVFLIDEHPYALLFGVRGARPYSFELPVYPGYRVPLRFDRHLRPLLDALGVTWNPASPFSTKLFLQDLNSHIPSYSAARDLPTDLLASRSAAVDIEEADKVYFVGWIAHNNGRSVSTANLEKTRRLLGGRIAERCERSNVSSRWSALTRDRRRIGDVPVQSRSVPMLHSR